MNKHTMVVVAVAVIATVVFYDQIAKLPLVNKLPRV